MSNETKQQHEKMGLFVIGQVMNRNHYPGRGGKPDRYSIDVAVPGNRQFLTISLDFEDWAKIELMTIFREKISFDLFNGRIYFQPSAS